MPRRRTVHAAVLRHDVDFGVNRCLRQSTARSAQDGCEWTSWRAPVETAPEPDTRRCIPRLRGTPPARQAWAARLPHLARDQHRHLERLLVVEARIDAGCGRRAARSASVEAARAADALGDVLAGELEVDAAEVASRAPRGRRRPARARGRMSSKRRVLKPSAWSRCCRASGSQHPQHACGRRGAPPRPAAAAVARLARRPCGG